MNQEFKRFTKLPIGMLMRKWLRILNPFPAVGGFDVGEGILRFLLIQEHDFLLASLRLPPGLFLQGVIRDRANFVNALQSIHEQIASAEKPIHVVVLLPTDTVSLQPFVLPLLPEDQIEEAATLNLAMVSPIDMSRAYADFQVIDASPDAAQQINLLGAFVERERVDELVSCLKEAGFRVVAVEFSALSVVRAVAAFAPALFRKESYLLAQATHAGISFMIVRSGNLYFHRFAPWTGLSLESTGQKVTAEAFGAFLAEETRKVLNFYSSRWGGTLGTALVLGGAVSEEIGRVLKTEFGLAVHTFTLPQAPDLDHAWLPALGAAWRGFTSQGGDRLINLASEVVAADYVHARISSFVGVWQKIVLTTLAFVLVVFVAGDSFLGYRERQASAGSASFPANGEAEEVGRLEREAEQFNIVLDRALKAKQRETNSAPFFERLAKLAGDAVTLRRVFISERAVSVVGSGGSEVMAIAFKNKLIRERDVTEVLLPLTNILPNPDGSVEFTVTFKLREVSGAP